MLVDKPQAFALARREQPHGILSDDVTCDHGDNS
jgi:hypothetical protein